MIELRGYHTSENKIGEFDMVTFFKVPPPDRITDIVIRVPDPRTTPFFMTRLDTNDAEYHIESAKEFWFNRLILQYSGAMYLFSGSVELYEVTIHELLDDPDAEAKEGYRLKMVIRNFAGDYWGTVWYDYLLLRNEGKSGGKKKVVNPYRGEGLFTTIERLIEGKYIVFADYRFEVRRADSDDDSTDKLRRKVALGMELYHGDWKHLEGLIKDYEQSLQSLERSRTTGLSHMKEFDISSEDLPSTIYSQNNGETKKEQRDSEGEENESGEEDSFGEFVTAR